MEKAKAELASMVEKMENEKEKDLIVENRFHRQLIGAKGGEIEKIRCKQIQSKMLKKSSWTFLTNAVGRKEFTAVQISFPDVGSKSDIVKLRGPKEDVDKCSKHFIKVFLLPSLLIFSSFSPHFPLIFPSFSPFARW